MKKTLEQRIFDKYDSLSQSERSLADVFLEHQGRIASYTAQELSALANVSNATAARLVRKLGYKSVTDARRQVRAAEHLGSPLERVADVGQTPEAADISLAQIIDTDVANLQMTDRNLDADDLARAVEILNSAQRIWVWGVRHGVGLAHIARHYLCFARTDVHLIQSGSGLGDDFASFRPNDALLVFGFRRRPASLVTQLEEARKTGLKIVMIADASAPRNMDNVDVMLRCWCNSPAVFSSLTAGVSVISYLSSALLAAAGEDGIGRLRSIERMVNIVDDIGPASDAAQKRVEVRRKKLED